MCDFCFKVTAATETDTYSHTLSPAFALPIVAALYTCWFAREAQWVAVVVFALPPLLLALTLLRGGGARAGFWAGVLALLWFSHEIGRAHVCTPVTNAHLVCRLLLEIKKKDTTITYNINMT